MSGDLFCITDLCCMAYLHMHSFSFDLSLNQDKSVCTYSMYISRYVQYVHKYVCTVCTQVGDKGDILA